MEDQSKKKYYLLIVLISVLVTAPLFAKGFFDTHDGDFHINRIIGTLQSIRDGQYLPMIIPNFVNGFGYGTNLFYPPLACYLPIFLMIFTCGNVLNAFKLMIFISVVISGITMFNLMFDITQNKKKSLIVAIIYLTVPYRLVDIYVRMAIGEILAFIFIPLVFQGLFNIINANGEKWYLLVIGTVGLLLAHNISTLLVALTAIIYVICYLDKILKEKKLKKLIVCLVFAIGMTVFFLAPFLETTVSSDYYVELYDDKTSLKAYSSYLYELFMGKINNGYLFTLSYPNKANNDICLTIGLQILVPLMFTPFIFKNISKANKNLYIITLIIGLLSALATTNIFPWDLFQNTIIGYIQFPMRMFIISTFTLSIIAGVNVYMLFNDKNSFKDIFILILVIFIYVQPIINLVKFNSEYDVYSGYEIEEISKYEYINSSKCSEFEYLPVKALKNFQYLQNRKNEILVLSGNTEISEQNKNGTKMTAVISNTLEDSVVELPYIYYKGYTCKIDDQKIDVVESENGMVSIEIPKGTEGGLSIKYTVTKCLYISLVISMLTCFTFAFCIAYTKLNHKKNDKIKGEIKWE